MRRHGIQITNASDCAGRHGETKTMCRSLIRRSRRGAALATSTCVLISFLVIDTPISIGAFRFTISKRPFSNPQSKTRRHHSARLLATMSTTAGRPGGNDAVAVPVAADGQFSPTYQVIDAQNLAAHRLRCCSKRNALHVKLPVLFVCDVRGEGGDGRRHGRTTRYVYQQSSFEACRRVHFQ